MLCFFFICEVATFGFLFRLKALNIGAGHPLETRNLIQQVPKQRRIACCVSDTLVVDATFIRRCEKHDFAIGIEPYIIFHGVLLLFPTVICLLCLYVFRTLNPTFRAIMKKMDVMPEPPPRVPQISQRGRRVFPGMATLQGLPKHD